MVGHEAGGGAGAVDAQQRGRHNQVLGQVEVRNVPFPGCWGRIHVVAYAQIQRERLSGAPVVLNVD